MVITDCDCLPSEFGHVAEVVPLPFDRTRFMEAIERVLGSPERYSSMREAGRALAEERSWGNLATRWLEKFAELRAS